jgi:hypothetical protein
MRSFSLNAREESLASNKGHFERKIRRPKGTVILKDGIKVADILLEHDWLGRPKHVLYDGYGFKIGEIRYVRQSENTRISLSPVAEDRDKHVRALARTLRGKDDEKLYKIAMEDNDIEMSLAATSKIESQPHLSLISLTHSNPVVRIAAVNRITDDSRLSSKARYDDDLEVRIAAISKTSDESTLESIAKYDEYYDAAIAALIRLRDISS